jgi:hypothetical protein
MDNFAGDAMSIYLQCGVPFTVLDTLHGIQNI